LGIAPDPFICPQKYPPEKSVRWPISRVLCRQRALAVTAIHLRCLLPDIFSNLPGQDAGSHLPFAWRLSLYGLAPDGVYHARSVTRPAVRSYRTFSPLPRMRGGLFSAALSLGLPPPGVTRHPDPVEPGLSSPLLRKKSSSHPAI